MPSLETGRDAALSSLAQALAADQASDGGDSCAGDDASDVAASDLVFLDDDDNSGSDADDTDAHSLAGSTRAADRATDRAADCAATSRSGGQVDGRPHNSHRRRRMQRPASGGVASSEIGDTDDDSQPNGLLAAWDSGDEWAGVSGDDAASREGGYAGAGLASSDGFSGSDDELVGAGQTMLQRQLAVSASRVTSVRERAAEATAARLLRRTAGTSGGGPPDLPRARAAETRVAPTAAPTTAALTMASERVQQMVGRLQRLTLQGVDSQGSSLGSSPKTPRAAAPVPVSWFGADGGAAGSTEHTAPAPTAAGHDRLGRAALQAPGNTRPSTGTSSSRRSSASSSAGHTWSRRPSAGARSTLLGYVGEK